MRVSWIDDEHLQALVARLEPLTPISRADDAPTEIATLPAGRGFLDDDDQEAPVAPPQQGPEREEYFPDLPQTTVSEAETPATVPEPDGPADEPDEDTTPLAGMDATLPLERIRERLRAIRHRVVEAGLMNRGAGEASASPAANEQSPAAETAPDPHADLTSFAEAEAASLPPGSTMIFLGADGGVLWSNEPKPGLILSMLMARRAAQHASIEALAGAPAISHQALSPDHTLSVTSFSTRGGVLQLAVKGGAPLDEALVGRWRAILAGI